MGKEFPGATVLVLSPSFAGTYSPTFDRVTLEAGQDIAKVSGTPVVAAQNFVTELTTPPFPVDALYDRARSRCCGGGRGHTVVAGPGPKSRRGGEIAGRGRFPDRLTAILLSKVTIR